MSNINKQALREAAEKATPRLWVETCGEVTTADYEVEGVTFLDHICNCEIIGTESQNAEFIAATNPATVLALLDELEAAEKRIAELEARVVVLPERYSMLHRDNFDEPYHTEFVYKQHQVLEVLHDAGISIKGE